MAADGYIFNERDKAEFNRLRRKLDSIRGPGVVNTPTSISIGDTQRNVPTGREDRDAVWAKVTSASGSANDYKHGWTEVVPTATGWQNATAGRSGTITNLPLIATDGSEFEVNTIVRAYLVIGDGVASYRAMVGGGDGSGCVPSGSSAFFIVKDIKWNEGGDGKLKFLRCGVIQNSCGQVFLDGSKPDEWVDVDTPADCG